MTDVLLLSPTAVPGGSERALAALARQLPRFGYHPHAVLLGRGPLEGWLADAGCPVEVMEIGRTRNLSRTLPVLVQLSRRFRDVKVVVANQSKGYAIASLAARWTRTPCVWWQHGIADRSRVHLAAAAIPAAAVVCSSTDAARAQRRLTPRGRIELINVGIDIEGVRRGVGKGAAVRARYGWNGPVVGIVARLQRWKGQELFLRAAALVAEARPDVRFAVVGGAILGWEGDHPIQLRKRAAALHIADRVAFVGHQDDVYPWFDALDVAVTASTGEPFGLVTLEAMALGAVVVGVRSAGTAEIVEPGKSGLLVEPDDPAAMAAAILEVLDDRSLAERLRVGGERRCEFFSDAAMASKFATLLGSLI